MRIDIIIFINFVLHYYIYSEQELVFIHKHTKTLINLLYHNIFILKKEEKKLETFKKKTLLVLILITYYT